MDRQLINIKERQTKLLERKLVFLPFEFPDVWSEIQNVLTTKITSITELEAAITRIGDLDDESNFISFFSSYFTKNITCKQSIKDKEILWIDRIIPFLQTIALRMPALFPDGIPILFAGQAGKVKLSREQVACILSHAFWGTFDRIPPIGLASFPELSFITLMRGSHHVAAMECIMHYFERISEKIPEGNIIITRRCLQQLPEWSQSAKPICKVTVTSDGTIEDSAAEWHIDFANEFIGGGVLHGGNVQEEILFLIKPECLVSMLFCEKMEVEDALIITGAERFSDYSGYGFKFKWKEDHKDNTPIDPENNCIKRNIIAIDAIVAGYGDSQFRKNNFLRDLNKSYCGFHNEHKDTIPDGASNQIATGNWGCGAFGGNLHLKAFQQILACSESNRELLYFTFRKPSLEQSIKEFVSEMTEKGITVGQLYSTYINNISSFKSREMNLLDFIRDCINQ